MQTLYQQMLGDPRHFLENAYDAGCELTTPQLNDIHLSAIRAAFERLAPHLSALRKLAAAQGIETVTHLAEAVSLLFPHTVYKSYPLSLLDGGKYTQLTRWLGGLTSVDLGAATCAGVNSLDDWIDWTGIH
jgi:hypothetical protein